MKRKKSIGDLVRSIFEDEEEIVITSIADTSDSYMLVGSVKHDNYRVLIAKLNKNGVLEWKKDFGFDSMDYEGQNIVAVKDGFLICGCSEGHASEHGGRDWKAYLLKVDLNGEKQWDRSYRILGNECAFSLVAQRNILLFGETRDSSGKCHLFLMNLDSHGEEVWKRIYYDDEDIVAGGIIPDNQGYVLTASLMRNKRWFLYLLKVDTDGQRSWDKLYKDTLVYDMCRGKNGIFLTGMKDDCVYLAKINEKGEDFWERTYQNGCGLAIDYDKKRIAIAGKTMVGESYFPVLYGISEDGVVEWRRIYEKDGFIEKVKQVNDGYILVRHGLKPKEHTEIIHVGEDGL